MATVKVDPAAAAARRQDGQHVTPCRRTKPAQSPEQWRQQNLVRFSRGELDVACLYFDERCIYQGKLWRVAKRFNGFVQLVGLQRQPPIRISEDTRVIEY